MKMNTKQRLLRAFLRLGGQLLEKLLTRTTVTGLENVPTEGVVIFAANHASTYDPVVLLNYLPPGVQFVGPGDFELLFPANHLIRQVGVIRVQRGAADRDSLKQMIEILKRGQMLALAPEGGTWEKRLDDVKSGAAYLSLMTGVPIVPVAVGGTYQVWGKIFRWQRPRISLHFAPPMPPVQSVDRQQRQRDLQQASLALMEIIYQHLPPEEQARYDLYARQRFDAVLEFAPALLEQPDSFSVLAELVSKPNLFSPLYRNLKLPLKPFVHHDRFYPAQQFLRAAEALIDAFENTVTGYLNYRLGDHKAQAALVELEKLRAISQQALELAVALRFMPRVQVLDSPTPPNT